MRISTQDVRRFSRARIKILRQFEHVSYRLLSINGVKSAMINNIVKLIVPFISFSFVQASSAYRMHLSISIIGNHRIFDIRSKEFYCVSLEDVHPICISRFYKGTLWGCTHARALYRNWKFLSKRENFVTLDTKVSKLNLKSVKRVKRNLII